MLIPLHNLRVRRWRAHVGIALVSAVIAPGFPSMANAQESPKQSALTQYKINEFAAAALTAEIAFSGVKGAPGPGEIPAQYALRVEGCIGALERLAIQMKPLRTLPAVQDASPENAVRWQRLGRAVRGLPSVARDVKQAWTSQQQKPGTRILGPKLMEGLATVQAILNGLRDARP